MQIALSCVILCMKGRDNMDTASVNFRMDRKQKAEMEQVCREMGMTMTTAFNIFAQRVIRERKIPFEVSADPFYSEKNMKRLEESIQQLEEGKVVVKTMEELEAMENE